MAVALDTASKACHIAKKCKVKHGFFQSLAGRDPVMTEGIKIKILIFSFPNLVISEQLHAELCFAECQLLRGILTFLRDESLISLLKGSFKMRACYLSYK